MSDEAKTVKRLRGQGDGFVVSSYVADTIERLIRERDEAERAGYEHGVREAAKVCDQCPDSHWGPWIRKRILALLEPVTLQKPEA
jgi:hypothetical protein